MVPRNSSFGEKSALKFVPGGGGVTLSPRVITMKKRHHCCIIPGINVNEGGSTIVGSPEFSGVGGVASLIRSGGRRCRKPWGGVEAEMKMSNVCVCECKL